MKISTKLISRLEKKAKIKYALQKLFKELQIELKEAFHRY